MDSYYKTFSKALLKAHSSLSDEVMERLFRFFELLVQYNDSHDLSRLKKIPDIIEKHFVDSIIIDTLTEIPRSILDIGTGAGFPGIPLKIIRPDLRLILGEPRPMRVEFMNRAIRDLSLSETSVFPHKVNEKMHFQVEGVITRAFESTPATLERCVNFLPEGGKIILMKGPGVDDELSQISGAMQRHYALTDDISYTLPGTVHKRRLVVFTKTTDYLRRFFSISDIPELTAGKPVTSPANSHFKELKKTAQPSAIKKTGRTLFSGAKIIDELCRKNPEIIEELVVYDSFSSSDKCTLSVIEDFERRKSLLIVKKGMFNELDTHATRQPLCVIKVPEIHKSVLDSVESPVLVIPFQDPVNAGSLIRTASAFGITSVIMTSEAVNPYHPRSIRASAGTVFSANISRGDSLEALVAEAASCGFTPVTLDMNGKALDSFDFPEKMIIIPGVEGPGLPDSLKKYAVSIPMTGDVESLNASVSGSILMYEFFRRKK